MITMRESSGAHTTYMTLKVVNSIGCSGNIEFDNTRLDRATFYF